MIRLPVLGLVLSLVALSACGPEDLITRGEYQRLRTGLSLPEVQRIVGAPGEQLSSTATQAVYQWKNSAASYASVTFVAGRATAITSVGLNETAKVKTKKVKKKKTRR
ncbi:hypothetical protein GO986_20135 [Deinococcus sp. HMF7620]|uniref:Lipoprotein SmpA/OmlA domain-containing protein n=1 Tax=Deinococcus arboris TaxID=2682977 RepID=A0A7C9HU33_9DEIO|nr:hypothetical protein [Deinococcus arboris]MVN89053.1 hypothetical protein [Deinococcus arboris]